MGWGSVKYGSSFARSWVALCIARVFSRYRSGSRLNTLAPVFVVAVRSYARLGSQAIEGACTTYRNKLFELSLTTRTIRNFVIGLYYFIVCLLGGMPISMFGRPHLTKTGHGRVNY